MSEQNKKAYIANA